MNDWYILNPDKTVRKANDTPDDINLAYLCVESKDKIVAQEHVGQAWVSTVFLGLDHNWGDGPPLVFETMVFRDDSGEEQYRYSTWQEAVDGHKKVCSELVSGLSREELEAAMAVITPLLSKGPDK